MMQAIQHSLNMIARMGRQLQFIVQRARTSIPVIDSGVVRLVQIILNYNMIRDNTILVQQYGFASNPPIGADCIVAFINGDPSNGAVIGTNHQSYGIKNMGNGAVGLYDMYGNNLILSSAGITITSSSNLTLTGQNVIIHATQSLKYDADGNGTEFTASARNDYVTGSTNTSHPLNPPAVP